MLFFFIYVLECGLQLISGLSLSDCNYFDSTLLWPAGLRQEASASASRRSSGSSSVQSLRRSLAASDLDLDRLDDDEENDEVLKGLYYSLRPDILVFSNLF